MFSFEFVQLLLGYILIFFEYRQLKLSFTAFFTLFHLAIFYSKQLKSACVFVVLSFDFCEGFKLCHPRCVCKD